MVSHIYESVCTFGYLGVCILSGSRLVGEKMERKTSKIEKRNKERGLVHKKGKNTKKKKEKRERVSLSLKSCQKQNTWERRWESNLAGQHTRNFNFFR